MNAKKYWTCRHISYNSSKLKLSIGFIFYVYKRNSPRPWTCEPFPYSKTWNSIIGGMVLSSIHFKVKWSEFLNRRPVQELQRRWPLRRSRHLTSWTTPTKQQSTSKYFYKRAVRFDKSWHETLLWKIFPPSGTIKIYLWIISFKEVTFVIFKKKIQKDQQD